MKAYTERIEGARKHLEKAECVLVGAGAGLSDAAGILYHGEAFRTHFQDFIRRYGFRDLYTSSFYPFETEEERWAYWAAHIQFARYAMPAKELYRDLRDLLREKEHFVLTTNVESQFQKAGFEPGQVFATQGDYGLFQCARACHNTLYDNRVQVEQLVAATRDCRIPSDLVPVCPVCGGRMDVNLRKDGFFVEDKNWYLARDRYEAFLKEANGRRLVLMELGVGFNTPGIIRYPFERMLHGKQASALIRMNRDHPEGPPENRHNTLSFPEEMGSVVRDLKTTKHARHLESMARLHKDQ
ncbi:MAG: Sir2 silent information regulator family NAD-dependent deacetylase [Bacteroidales bacterium]